MPLLFEGSSIQAGSRSHSRLTRSPGDVPATDYIVDENLPGLFTYTYGGWTLSGTKVVIPKGTVLAAGPHQQDYRTLKKKNALTFAGGTSGNSLGTPDNSYFPIGVAPYNYYRRFDADGNIMHDFSEGDDDMIPVLTRDYIELPYLADPEFVYKWDTSSVPALADDTNVTGMKFNWGCATNIMANYEDSTKRLKPGDFVKPGPYGKLIRWETGDDPRLVVGRVYELVTDVPPEGWLEWVLSEREDDPLRADDENMQAAPDDGSNYGIQSDYFWPADKYDLDKPIKGLHDGAKMKARNEKFGITVAVENTGVTEDVQLDPILKVDKASLVVKVGETELDEVADASVEDGWEFNEETQVLTVGYGSAATADTYSGTIEYEVSQSTEGVIPSWDYAGSVGAIRILLTF